MTWILVLYLCIAILVVVLHSISLGLLVKLKSGYINGSQKYLLIALSCNDLALGINAALDCIMDILKMDDSIRYIIFLFDLTPLYLIYISVMILITLDRLLEFRLNIKYSLYWSPKKTLKFLVCLVSVSVCISICVIILHKLYGFNFAKIYMKYILPQFSGIFMILATYTYYVIFNKIKKNRKEDMKMRREKKNNKSTQRTTPSKRRFQVFLPSWIMATYILFGMVPYIIFIIHFDATGAKHEALNELIKILYALGWLADAFLYIFSLKPIRKEFRRFSR